MVFPLKDTLPGDRAPAVTLGLVAVTAVVVLAGDGAGWDGSAPGVLQMALALLFVWIFGSTLEDSLGRRSLVALWAGGALATVALVAALGGAGSAPSGATGAVSALLGGHVVLHPRARVLCVSLVPLFFTMVEVPVPVLLAVWAALPAAGVLGDIVGAGVILGAQVACFALGAAAVRLLGRSGRDAPAPYRIA